jgi:hypothetical protein
MDKDRVAEVRFSLYNRGMAGLRSATLFFIAIILAPSYTLADSRTPDIAPAVSDENPAA